MSKKLLSVLLALMLVLGCTVMAGAETVTVNEYADDPVLSQMDADLLDEVKEAVIDTLPEDLQGKEYFISEGTEPSGENRALVATEDCTAQTIQKLIDDGFVRLEDVDVPDGATVTIKEVDAVVPFIEDENGEYVNALSTRALNSSWTYTTSLNQGDENSSYFNTYGKIYMYCYDFTVSSGNYRAFRPVTLYGKYTSTASTTVTEMIVTFRYSEVTCVPYPEYLEGTSTSSTWYEHYTLVRSVSNPTAGILYGLDTGLNNYCLIDNPDFAFTLGIDLYNGSTWLCASEVFF